MSREIDGSAEKEGVWSRETWPYGSGLSKRRWRRGRFFEGRGNPLGDPDVLQPSLFPTYAGISRSGAGIKAFLCAHLHAAIPPL